MLMLCSITFLATYACVSCLFAISLALARSRSHTAARQSNSFSTLAWFLPHPPTPITAILVSLRVVPTIQRSTTPCILWLRQTLSWHTFHGYPLSTALPFRYLQGGNLYW